MELYILPLKLSSLHVYDIISVWSLISLHYPTLDLFRLLLFALKSSFLTAEQLIVLVTLFE